MEWSSLQLKVISCKGLKSFTFLQKQSTSAVIAIIDDEVKMNKQQQLQLQRQKTPIDRDGGKNPEWNHTLQFDLQQISYLDRLDHLFLKFELRCEGTIFGINNIGEVRVPLKDLIEEFNGVIRFVSYQVRNSDGKPNGVLNFSYKLNGKLSNTENESDSSEVVKPSMDTEKIRYPKLEVQDRSGNTCYPSLDDVLSPLPEISSTYKDYQKPIIYEKALPPSSPLQPMSGMHQTYYNLSPTPWIHTPQPYGYMAEPTGYGCGQWGQFGSGTGGSSGLWTSGS